MYISSLTRSCRLRSLLVRFLAPLFYPLLYTIMIAANYEMVLCYD